MRKIILTSLLCLTVISLFPQGNPKGKAPAQLPTIFTEGNRVTQLIKEKIIDNTDSNTQTVNIEFIGNAYLNEEYLPGRIFFNDRDMGAYLLRYNIFAEEFETLKGDGVAVVYKTSEVTVEMDGKEYVFKYYLNEDHKEFGYFEIVKPYNRITLLKKHRKLVQEGKTAITF